MGDDGSGRLGFKARESENSTRITGHAGSTTYLLLWIRLQSNLPLSRTQISHREHREHRVVKEHLRRAHREEHRVLRNTLSSQLTSGSFPLLEIL
jgi:hypothetical protein